MPIDILTHTSLAPFTSFRVGGEAEYLAIVSSTEELLTVLRQDSWEHIWLLGFGSNTLLSDAGLPGLTVVMRGGTIAHEGTDIIADAGVWWDDVVKSAIDSDLWGIELMSEIPGSVGAATFINITAYGQSIGPLVAWVDVWDKDKERVNRYSRDELEWSYKSSVFQKSAHAHEIILRVCLRLQEEETDQVDYQKAIDVADELKIGLSTLRGRRECIIEARKRAGSLWSPSDTDSRTAGSFFRNVVVTHEQALVIASYDETGKTTDQVMKMNQVHGGSTTRVSAAHIMLAAGFRRGQRFGGHVKLHDKNLLKIEALEGATAQDVYETMRTIQKTVQEKLKVTLEPEAQLLGEFKDV